MDSLFETNFENTQPLRKLEPLIRFDIDGNPQPRRPLSETPKVEEKPVEERKEKEALKEKVPPPPPSSRVSDDLKRKVHEPPACGIEPKRKQQKQTSITNFFKKS